MMWTNWPERFKRSLHNPNFWIVLAVLALCAIISYPKQIGLLSPSSPDSLFGLTDYTVERVFYLVPIVYAGYMLGPAAGLTTTFFALVLMIPNALFISPNPTNAMLEIGGIVLVGVMANFWFSARTRQAEAATQRQQAITAMTTAQDKLRTQIRSTIRREKELVALSRLSSSLGESLEMEPLLRSAATMVMEILGVEVILIYSLDEEASTLTLVAYEGVPAEFAQSVDRMKVGEGFNGRVAETGLPLLVEDASRDPRLTRESIKKERLQSQLIVPMKSRGKVIGTLCAAVRQQRVFTAEETELLIAMASNIGITIENTRLYQEQLAAIKQLSISENKYRSLFESAHDAIWVHGMDGNIISANEAVARLTGYEVDDLLKMNVRDFLSEGSLKLAKELRSKLLNGEVVAQPYEQKLITKQGTEAILKLTTNIVTGNGKAIGFQHIARDVTDERRMEENLRSYVQQITRSQEEERLRIARELHDSSAQKLIALLHQLETFLRDQAELPMEKTRELWSFHEQIKDILQEIRSLSRDLRPSLLDDVGLLSALQWVVRGLKKDYGIDASLQVYGVERRFSQEVELLLFRVVQEALRNIGKHSNASNAEVSITFNESTTTVIIRDNGKGFKLPTKISDLSRSGKLGLVGMQERVRLLGGRLELKSEPDRGTTVLVEAPV